MTDTLVGAIVGGLIAVLGGFGGAWFIRWRDDKRMDREQRAKRIGSLRVLAVELSENVDNLKLRIKERRWTGKLEYRDQAYNDLQHFIAMAVEIESWKAIQAAYGLLRSSALYHEEMGSGGSVERWQLDSDRADVLLARLNAAGNALRVEQLRRAKKGG